MGSSHINFDSNLRILMTKVLILLAEFGVQIFVVAKNSMMPQMFRMVSQCYDKKADIKTLRM